MKSNKNKKNNEQADVIRGPLKKPSLAERQYSEPVAVDHVDGAGFSRSQSTPDAIRERSGFNPDILPDGICISPQRVASRQQDTSQSAVRDAEVIPSKLHSFVSHLLPPPPPVFIDMNVKSSDRSRSFPFPPQYVLSSSNVPNCHDMYKSKKNWGGGWLVGGGGGVKMDFVV